MNDEPVFLFSLLSDRKEAPSNAQRTEREREREKKKYLSRKRGARVARPLTGSPLFSILRLVGGGKRARDRGNQQKKKNMRRARLEGTKRKEEEDPAATMMDEDQTAIMAHQGVDRAKGSNHQHMNHMHHSPAVRLAQRRPAPSIGRKFISLFFVLPAPRSGMN